LGSNAREPAQLGFVTKAMGNSTTPAREETPAPGKHPITAVTPVELAGDSPKVVITPPAYARATRETSTRNGIMELTALKHGELSFEFAFTRPAVKAWLEWSAEANDRSKKTPKIDNVPLVLSSDALSAKLTVPVKSNAEIKLVLEAEHGVRTEYAGGGLVVQEDQPPALIKYVGKETLLNARAFDRIPIEARLA